MAKRYFSRIWHAVFSGLGRVTGGVPPRYGADLVGRSVIEVARTRVVGRGRQVRSIGIMPPNSYQPADILLQVSFLNKGFNLVPELEAFNRVVPPVLVKLAIFCHVPSFCWGSH